MWQQYFSLWVSQELRAQPQESWPGFSSQEEEATANLHLHHPSASWQEMPFLSADQIQWPGDHSFLHSRSGCEGEHLPLTEPFMDKYQNHWFSFFLTLRSYTTTQRHWRQSRPTHHVDPLSLAPSPKNPSCMVWKIAALPSPTMLPKARLTRSYLPRPHLFHQVLSIPSCRLACPLITTLMHSYALLLIYINTWSHQIKYMQCHNLEAFEKRDSVMGSWLRVTYHGIHNK